MSGHLVRILFYLILAFVVGTAAQIITGYHKRRVLTTLILGFVGVFAGDFIAQHFRFPHILPPVFGVSLVWSIVGAILFILAFRFLRGRW
jgi:uncharacterized membrane protein YeaQ/YmgE (transglycosylase-associated protein family)